MNTANQESYASGNRKTFGFVWSRICRSRTTARLRPRRFRRALVISSILILGAMPLVGWLTGEIALAAMLLVPYMAVNILLAASTGGLFERRMSSLDERERMLRLTVFREPYIVGVTIGILVGWIGLGGLSSDEGWLNGLVLAVLSSAYLIPTKVLAWNIPDEAFDEE